MKTLWNILTDAVGFIILIGILWLLVLAAALMINP